MDSHFYHLHFFANRIKTVSFEKKGLLLEIPKCLSIGNIVIRCIFTNYDYFSERSRLFNPPPNIPETSVDHQHVVEVTIDEVCYFIIRVLKLMCNQTINHIPKIYEHLVTQTIVFTNEKCRIYILIEHIFQC